MRIIAGNEDGNLNRARARLVYVFTVSNVSIR